MDEDFSFLKQYSEQSKEEVEYCQVEGCDREVYSDCEKGLCYHHHMNYCVRGWASPTYICIKECELPTCDETFEQKNYSQKYCEHHRVGGDRHIETERVAWRGWEKAERTCPCGTKVPKGRWKYCCEECYEKYSKEQSYRRNRELVKVEYGLSDDELEVLSQFAIELSYLKSSNYPVFIESLKDMIKEEGERFTKMVLELVSISKEEKEKLGL